jgi:hypothetical protein
VFIVPHVPLVSQQANFIRQTTQLVVGEYHGHKGVDLWSREQWEKEFVSTDVLVMTGTPFPWQPADKGLTRKIQLKYSKMSSPMLIGNSKMYPFLFLIPS